MSAPFFVGIDIGTQGARVLLMDAQGTPIASAEEVFPLSAQSMEEQSPQTWWDTCLHCLKAVLAQASSVISLNDVTAISVTSTSGTVIPLDASFQPLHPAIMYSDKRSAAQGIRCRELALAHHPDGYTGFNASSGLSKMVWFAETFPDLAGRIERWVHAADFIIGKLSGRWDVTDYTNALKSGFDIRALQWPSWITDHLPVAKHTLPRVVPSGEPVGGLSKELARETGLSAATQVIAGMTDGCASQIASGAVALGDWNTTIGTTLVIKGVTSSEIKDPFDRLYNHRHPEGYWMPGGAANIGAAWVTERFGDRYKLLNEEAPALLPTGTMAYPLLQQGERFPFIAPNARGFYPENVSDATLYTACMEGVAYVERYAYDVIRHLSGEQVNTVYTAGGGSNSDAWLTIRANVLGLPICKKKQVTGAAGAAILAASRTYYTSLTEAAKAMTQTENVVEPQPVLTARYEDYYHQFLHTLVQKEIISL